MEDKLTDFERAEYYKTRLKNQYKVTTVISALTFVLGFVIARAVYLAI